MPSRSKKQQRLFGMIHALQKGELDPDSVSEEVRELAKKIDPESVRHFAVTKHKGLPEKKAEDYDTETARRAAELLAEAVKDKRYIVSTPEKKYINYKMNPRLNKTDLPVKLASLLSSHLSTKDGLRKIAQVFDGNAVTLTEGKTPGHVVSEWNKLHPNQKMTIKQFLEANGNLDPVKFRAGRRYNLPSGYVYSQAAEQTQPTPKQPAQIQSAERIPSVKEDQKNTTDGKHSWITNLALSSGLNPRSLFIHDIIRAHTNRKLRDNYFIGPDDTLISGPEIEDVSDKQKAYLRMMLQAKYKSGIPENGRFGGIRPKSNQWKDDYQTYIHPGFRYGQAPSLDKEQESRWYKPWTWSILNSIRTANKRTTGLPMQVENSLGDFSFNTDEDGNVIIRDVYDFNEGEGNSQEGTSYGGIRQFAGKYGSKSTDPIEQKARFKINLGNPTNWPAFNQKAFYDYNKPYRDIPEWDFYQNEEEPEATPPMLRQPSILKNKPVIYR